MPGGGSGLRGHPGSHVAVNQVERVRISRLRWASCSLGVQSVTAVILHQDTLQPHDLPPGGSIVTPWRVAEATRTDRRLLGTAALTLGSRTGAKLAQLAFLLIAARILTVEQFASYSYILVLATTFTILADTGVPLIAGRDISSGRGSAADLFWSSAPVVAVSAAAAGILLLGVGLVDSGPGSRLASVLLAVAFVIANRLSDFATTTLRSLGRLRLEAILQIGGALAFVAVATVAAGLQLGVWAILMVLCVKELASGGVAWCALRPDLRGRRRGRIGWRSLLRAGISLSLASTALAVVLRLPLLVLGNSAGPESVADFSAAQRFSDAAMIVATSAGFALLPGLSHLARIDPARARRLISRTLVGLALIGTVLAAVMARAAPTAIEVVFGHEFAGGGQTLRILMLGLPAYAVLSVCWFAIIAFGGETDVLRLGVGGLVVSAVLALKLIPGGGQTAAAVAYVAPLGAMALAAGFLLRARIRSSVEAPLPAPSLA